MGELGATLTYAEFTEWMAFYACEPWGCDTEDFRTALVARTVANGLRSADTSPLSIDDFMPKRGPVDAEKPEEPALSDDELAAWADAAIFGLPPE